MLLICEPFHRGISNAPNIHQISLALEVMQFSNRGMVQGWCLTIKIIQCILYKVQVPSQYKIIVKSWIQFFNYVSYFLHSLYLLSLVIGIIEVNKQERGILNQTFQNNISALFINSFILDFKADIFTESN